MSVDKETVRRIAGLARISVPEEDLAPLAGELSLILDWVEQLGELETGNVAPMTRVGDMAMKKRTDEVTDGGYRDDVLKNAPETADGFFVVPKVVE